MKPEIFGGALCMAAAGVSISATPLTAAPRGKHTRPNVILIMTDQHNADVMGFRNHPDAHTPNLDRMAAQGVAYTRAYCADAISAASRNSLFTGYYPRSLGTLNNANVMRKSSVLGQAVSLQQCFKNADYKTYAFGKRHLFGKADEGWDVRKSHLANESPQENYVSWIESRGLADEFGQDWSVGAGKYPMGNSLAETPGEKAPMATRQSALDENATMEAYTGLQTIEMLRDYAAGDRSQPFFCFASFYRPHQPYTPLKKYWDRYDRSTWGEGTNHGSSIAMPPTLRQPKEDLPKMLRNQRSSRNLPWCLGMAAENEQLYRDYISAYYALVEEVDHWIGQIFETLEETGLAENTIVIYTSDHGDFVGRHGMIEKASVGHNVYEETLRVPLIFWWKNHLPAGDERTDLISLVDLYPTLVDMVGIQAPFTRYALQGQSYKKNLIKGTASKREYVVSENWSQASVITDRYKLGIWLEPPHMYRNHDYRDQGNMLFDREQDPDEVNNVYEQADYEAVRQSLFSCFEEFESKITDAGKRDVAGSQKQKRKK